MKNRVRISLAVVALGFLFLSSDRIATAQEELPPKEPFTVQFEMPDDYPDCKYFPTTFVELFEQMPLTISEGTFSGTATAVVKYDKSPFSNVRCETGKNKSLTGSNYQQTFKISGTYENGILEGTWTNEANIIEYPANPGDDDVHKNIKASGTLSSSGPLTATEIPVIFSGSYSYDIDGWFEGELLGTRGMENVVEATFNLVVVTDEEQQPGEVGGSEGEDGGITGGDEGGGATGSGGGDEDSAAPPGIGGIDDLPGPENLPEAMAGILLPGIIGILGGLLAGGAGGGGGGAGWEEPPDGDSPETEPSDYGGTGGADPAAEHAKHVLDIFDKRTGIDKNPELKALADKARETAFGPDGSLIPEKWNEIKDQMRDAISSHAGEPGYDPSLPSSIIGEQIDGTVATAVDVWDKTSEAAGNIGGAVKEGFEGVADGIMNPADFFRGVREGILDWNHKNTEDWRTFADKFSEAGKEGGLPAAMEVMTESLWESEKKLWGGLWEHGKEMLPVEEFKSLMDENASMEEKLWAVPAAAAKIAGLLVGTEAGGARVPGTGNFTLIPSERAAAAAAEEAVARSAAGLTEARGAESVRIGKPAKLPPAAARAEAGAEAAAKEAEKSAERLAEQMKGDKLRTAAEQKFSDPAQRAGYQSEYKQYMDQAQKKADSVVDVVKSGEAPSVDQALDTMSDPAAMRNLKNTPAEARKSFIETQNKVLEPTKKDVESFLSEKYKGEEFKVDSVRTPGKNYDPATSINTDNDVHAVRKIVGKDGSVSWKEVPSSEWEQAYHDSFAKNSNFTTDTAKSRFPEVEWDSMTQQQQTRKWGELHQQEPGDVFSSTSARDFRKISEDPLHTGPKVEESTHSLAKKGTGKLSDPEQLATMESEKFTKEWNKGTIPHQKEALEQLSKKGKEVEGLIDGYQKNHQVSDLSPKMKEALKVIEDNTLSPLERAEKIKDLGFNGGPQEVSERLSAKISSLKLAKPK